MAFQGSHPPGFSAQQGFLPFPPESLCPPHSVTSFLTEQFLCCSDYTLSIKTLGLQCGPFPSFHSISPESLIQAHNFYGHFWIHTFQSSLSLPDFPPELRPQCPPPTEHHPEIVGVRSRIPAGRCVALQCRSREDFLDNPVWSPVRHDSYVKCCVKPEVMGCNGNALRRSLGHPKPQVWPLG